jgi:Amt family ammonium transporter
MFGNPRQLGIQVLAAIAAIAFSAAASFVLFKLVSLFTPLRVAGREEGLGLDVSQHGEEAYARDEGAILLLPEPAAPQPAAALRPSFSTEGGRP